MAKNTVKRLRGGPRFIQDAKHDENTLAAFVPELAVTERQSRDGRFVRDVYPAAVMELRENGLARDVVRDPNRAAIRVAATAAVYIWMVCHAVRLIGLRRGR